MMLISVLLPAPFSPTKAWHLSGREVQRNAVERHHARKTARDVDQLQERRGIVHGISTRTTIGPERRAGRPRRRRLQERGPLWAVPVSRPGRP